MCYSAVGDNVTQAIEIEFKNLLTEKEFQEILKQYSFTAPFVQTNYYFDTSAKLLQQKSIGLRIRLFQTTAEQTLKLSTTKAEHQLTEITDPLTLTQAQALVQQNQIYLHGATANQLTRLKVKISDLQIIGLAKTERYLATLPAGLLTLDRTTYADHAQDYECELEIQNVAKAYQNKHFFLNLLAQNDIPNRAVTNKVVRAVQHFKS